MKDTKINVTLTISLQITDEDSQIEFLDASILPHDFAEALTGLSRRSFADCEVR